MTKSWFNKLADTAKNVTAPAKAPVAAPAKAAVQAKPAAPTPPPKRGPPPPPRGVRPRGYRPDVKGMKNFTGKSTAPQT